MLIAQVQICNWIQVTTFSAIYILTTMRSISNSEEDIRNSKGSIYKFSGSIFKISFFVERQYALALGISR